MSVTDWLVLTLGVMILLAMWMLGSYLKSILGELSELNRRLKGGER